MSVSGSDVSFKSIDGLGPNTKGGTGGGSGAPTNVAYALITGAGAAALTNYRQLVAGTGITFTDGGPQGNFTVGNSNPTQFVDKSADGLERWIQFTGIDTDDGSVTHPKQSVLSTNSSLLAAIPPPSFAAGASVFIGPGAFPDVIVMEHDVFYVGVNPGSTLINGGLTSSPYVVVGPFPKFLTGIMGLNFINTPVNWDPSQAKGGINIFKGCAFSSGTTFQDPQDTTTTTQVFDTFFNLGDLTITGGIYNFANCFTDDYPFPTKTIINSSINEPTTIKFNRCKFGGDIDINWTPGHQPMIIDLGSSDLGQYNLTVNGIPISGDVTITLPKSYNIYTTTGVVITTNNYNSAVALVSNNGLTNTSFFGAAAPTPGAQVATTDGAGLGIWDFPFQILFGGQKVITVQDASTTNIGDVLTIVDNATNPMSAAYQAPVAAVTVTNRDFYYSQISTGGTYSYTGNGTKDLDTFFPVNAFPALFDTLYDPFVMFGPDATWAGKVFIYPTGGGPTKRNIKFEVTFDTYINPPDANATYTFYLKSSDPVHNADYLIANYTQAFTERLAISGSVQVPADISDVPYWYLVVVVAGSDGLNHDIQFGGLSWIVKILAQ